MKLNMKNCAKSIIKILNFHSCQMKISSFLSSKMYHTWCVFCNRLNKLFIWKRCLFSIFEIEFTKCFKLTLLFTCCHFIWFTWEKCDRNIKAQDKIKLYQQYRFFQYSVYSYLFSAFFDTDSTAFLCKSCFYSVYFFRIRSSHASRRSEHMLNTLAPLVRWCRLRSSTINITYSLVHMKKQVFFHSCIGLF